MNKEKNKENEYAILKKHGGSNAIYKKTGKKEILGKIRIIYKMKGSNKEYINNKGVFMHITEYKNLKKKKGGMMKSIRNFLKTSTTKNGEKEEKEEKKETKVLISCEVGCFNNDTQQSQQSPQSPQQSQPSIKGLNSHGLACRNRKNKNDEIIRQSMLGINPDKPELNPRK